ncbi:hypothetical protein, conserved [Plasmodium ovale]|uniref:PIR protein n=1 Tax=Plasmodium ovale TaxID=36330 RepID=A0A1C3KIV2_PLAOA|nr:hypothetical protein, conserved [Plasmodium ovale]
MNLVLQSILMFYNIIYFHHFNKLDSKIDKINCAKQSICVSLQTTHDPIDIAQYEYRHSTISTISSVLGIFLLLFFFTRNNLSDEVNKEILDDISEFSNTNSSNGI